MTQALEQDSILCIVYLILWGLSSNILVIVNHIFVIYSDVIVTGLTLAYVYVVIGLVCLKWTLCQKVRMKCYDLYRLICLDRRRIEKGLRKKRVTGTQLRWHWSCTLEIIVLASIALTSLYLALLLWHAFTD